MKLNGIFLGCLLAVTAGCSEFLDVQPKDKQSEQQLFATRGGFYSAANGIYNKLASPSLYGANLSYGMIDVMAKRYLPVASNTYLKALAMFDYGESQVERNLAAVWEEAYNTVLNCNVLLKNLEENPGVLAREEADVLRGEMLAVRAFLHFDLLRLFGPVYRNNPQAEAIPYNESHEISALEFMTADSVLEYKILRDMDLAEELLASADPVIGNGAMASMEEDGDVHLRYRQLRFNYYAVQALKARVHLYAGNRAEALACARKLLDDGQMHAHFPAVDPNRLLANQSNPDRVFSTEVLSAIYLKDRKDIYTYNFDPEQSGNNFLQPRNGYVDGNLFGSETQDYRFQSWWETAAGVGVRGYAFIKYKGIRKPDESDRNSEYFYATLIPLVRLSEVYYIAAECEEDLGARYEWLNRIRARRGLDGLPAVSEKDLMTQLRKEYLKEFMGEGQIFYMYKRMFVDIVAAENGCDRWNAWCNNDQTFVLPLPADEIKNR